MPSTLILMIFLSSCFRLDNSAESWADGFIGHSIDETIKTIKIFNARNAKQRRKPPRFMGPDFVKNHLQDQIYLVEKMEDGSYIFDLTNYLRTGCKIRYYANEEKIITSFTFLNDDCIVGRR